MTYKILVADDEPNLVSTVRAYLEDSGFEVVTAYSGREAMFANRYERPDLIILDLMMPEMDGWEAARLIRRESSVPIIMLTARVEDTDRIAGLEMGADDYVTKPFNPRELVARVRAVLRRTHGEVAGDSPVLRIGSLEVDRESHRATLGGRPYPQRVRPARSADGAAWPCLHADGIAGSYPGGGIRGLRAHHRCARQKPTSQDRGRPAQPTLH